jgi:hypothetical protein
MKSKKEHMLTKLQNKVPYIALPYNLNQGVLAPAFIDFKYAIEHAMKTYMDAALKDIVDDIYTTEEFEEDLSLR